MAVPNLFKFAERRKPADNPDPGGYKAAPYGSFPQDVMSDGWGWDPETARQKREDAVRERSIPKIDSNDVVGSLNGILGPSPEERAAEEKRQQEHRRQMHGWTSLFNGLRHLGNLYYAAKGAPGQKFSDPHQQIEQQYQDERKRLADIHAADQKYYANLWGLYRQMNDEQRRNALAEAQSQYYGTRDEMARQKAELDKLKAVRVIKQTDGSLVKFDPVTGETEQLTETDPLYVERMQSIIEKNRQQGNAAMIRANKAGGGGRSSGTSTTTTVNEYNEDGKITKKVVTKGGSSQPRSGGGKGGRKKVKW